MTKTKTIIALLVVMGIVYMLSGTKTVIITNEAQETQEEQKKQKIDVSKLSKYIYQKESSSGVNCYSKCKAINETNCIGYGIYDGKYICFNSHDDEMKELEKWLNKRIAEGLNEQQLLCYYNTGIIQEKCKYIKNWGGVDNFIQ